ncbi:hypothetical protein [Micromonospora sp. NPDC048830]|uniref:hypothetical protein n=1 Tax=Micromonospora sp. NPDC048830 TaxID=3364257 RepID=UPI00371554E8
MSADLAEPALLSFVTTSTGVRVAFRAADNGAMETGLRRRGGGCGRFTVIGVARGSA